MKIIILGSGVIGVTSAWYLSQAGHEVTVVDRQSGPALETSYANAGELSPGCAFPWAAPGLPLKALGWMLAEHPPLIIRMRFDLAMFRWLGAMLINCTDARYAVNKSKMVRLAEYSMECLGALRQRLPLSYDQGARGILQLFRNQDAFDGFARDVDVLRDSGVDFALLDRKGCLTAEPGLAYAGTTIAGGIHFPRDETGDCRKFTVALADHAAEAGVKFVYNCSVNGLSVDGDRIAGVETGSGLMQADAYVVCFGSYSPKLLRPLGLKLPVYPVKGYSLTAAIASKKSAPLSTVIDDRHKVAITRLGDRIRIGGIAEITGFDRRLDTRRQASLEHSLGTLFTGAARRDDLNFWTGLRPMTPDGPPVIGATPYRNLHLNTGHGAFGWTMACGSGQLIADMLSGKTSPIRTDDLSIDRYLR